MKSCRPFLLIFAGALLALVVIGVALAISIHQAEMLVIDIQPAPGSTGDRVSLRMPGALATTAAYLLPKDLLRRADADARRWGPLAREACERLQQAPDCELVSVENADENVHIVKRGHSLIVDVRDANETVHLVLPLSAAKAILRRLSDV
jgi:hypothetical protein